MMLYILHLAEDWIGVFHETYFRVDSSQRAYFEPVLMRREGFRLHGSVGNMREPQYPYFLDMLRIIIATSLFISKIVELLCSCSQNVLLNICL